VGREELLSGMEGRSWGELASSWGEETYIVYMEDNSERKVF